MLNMAIKTLGYFPLTKSIFLLSLLPIFVNSLSYYLFHSSHICEMGLYAFSSKDMLSGLILHNLLGKPEHFNITPY